MQDLKEFLLDFCGVKGVDTKIKYKDLDEGCPAEVEINYKYLWIHIIIDLNQITDIDIFFTSLTHEICHFHTWTGVIIFHSEFRDVINDRMGIPQGNSILRGLKAEGERATTILERKFFNDFKKTKDYKKYKTLFSKYF